MLNKRLFETFEDACQQRDLTIEWQASSLNVYFDNGNYIMLWTPLNKCPRRPIEGSDFVIRQMLIELNDNMHDYHIECNAKDPDRMMRISTASWSNGMISKLQNNPTVKGWFELFDFCQDNDAIDTDYAFSLFTQEEEVV